MLLSEQDRYMCPYVGLSIQARYHFNHRANVVSNTFPFFFYVFPTFGCRRRHAFVPPVSLIYTIANSKAIFNPTSKL